MSEQLDILIRKCQENNREAQSKIYELFAPKLFSICLRYSQNYEEAQDTFQEGFIIIFNKIHHFRFEGSFEGWMRRIMVNACINKHRNKNHLYVINEELTGQEETFDIEIEENQNSLENLTYEEILSYVQQLPNRYRQVFNLYVIEKLPHNEIAQKLNISVGTSKSNLSRAREKLKELLKNNKLKSLSK